MSVLLLSPVVLDGALSRSIDRTNQPNQPNKLSIDGNKAPQYFEANTLIFDRDGVDARWAYDVLD
jgi:hypothetical protein